MAIIAHSGIEANNPQLAEDRLLVAAVGKGVSARTHEGLVGEVLLLRADTAVALGTLQDALASFVREDTSFDSSHMQ